MSLTVSLVAIPLGNPKDLSPRAAETLATVDRIFCEDTRKTKDLLARSGVTFRARLTALPGDSEHDYDWVRELERAAPNESWALVSDAGTPLVNDPGAGLLAFCHKQNIPVVAVPGPCAPVLAWQWSGGFGLPFVFAGFVPKAKNAGAKALTEFFATVQTAGTFSYFDTKHQFSTTLDHLMESGWADRPMFVAREMTKSHEELVRGTVRECAEQLRRRLSESDALGEMTFVLKGFGSEASTAVAGVSLEQLAELRNVGTKDAAKIAAQLTGKSVKDCYDTFVEKKNS
ncbi:MAG: hypothetical protein JST16_18190 [Bdellovibrionales bacterium]|nr:hypothetical protein [Bdellovibrionales bacterium]